MTEPTPLPGVRQLPGDGTDEVSSVPLTDLNNLHLDSGERPKLPLFPPKSDLGGSNILLFLLLAVGLVAAAVFTFLLVR